MPSKFTQYGGVAGAEDALRQMVAERIAAQMQAEKIAQERYKLSQEDARIGQGDRRMDIDVDQFGKTHQLNLDKFGQQKTEFDAGAPEREARTGYLRTQTKDLEQKPLYAEQARQAAEARDRAQHGYRLGEIAASNANRQERTVQIMGPNGVPIWVKESDAVGQPAAQAARAVTGQERGVVGFFNRMLEAERNARKVEDKLSGPDVAAQEYAPAWLTNWLQTPEGQQYQQAQRTYTEARLRKESGAAIPQGEFDTDRRSNFRLPGDKPETIKQKRQSRLTTMRGLGNAAGRALQEYYGEGATLDSLLKEFEDAGAPVAMVAPDGRALMVPPEKVAEMEARGAKRR